MAEPTPTTTEASKANAPFIPAAQKLRNMLAEKGKVIVCPGVYDGFTARIALREGVDCLYMTGAGTTMSRLGMADMGLATMNDMRDNASMIANIDPSVPLIADADTGYGGTINVARTVHAYILAGVAALHLEDQLTTKRCGHLRNKQLVSLSEYTSRIKAAALARAQSPSDIVIIARTDALQSLGYDDALARMKAAVAVGADVAFLEGVRSRQEAERFCRDMGDTPCLFNCVVGGVSPVFSVGEAREIGYRVMIYPLLAVEMVYPVVRRAVRQLLDRGRVEAFESRQGEDWEEGKRYGPRELFEVCGLGELMAFDVEAGGTAYADGA